MHLGIKKINRWINWWIAQWNPYIAAAALERGVRRRCHSGSNGLWRVRFVIFHRTSRLFDCLLQRCLLCVVLCPSCLHSLDEPHCISLFLWCDAIVAVGNGMDWSESTRLCFWINKRVRALSLLLLSLYSCKKFVVTDIFVCVDFHIRQKHSFFAVKPSRVGGWSLFSVRRVSEWVESSESSRSSQSVTVLKMKFWKTKRGKGRRSFSQNQWSRPTIQTASKNQQPYRTNNQ